MAETLDLSQPVALMLVAILHFLVDADDPAAIVGTLLAALPPGSYLVASHVTPEHDPAGVGGLDARLPAGRHPRPGPAAEDFEALAFRGPGDDRPGRGARLGVAPARRAPAAAEEVNWYGGIGRKTA